MEPIKICDTECLALAEACRQSGGRLYAVGGAVRNALLGLPASDLDIAGPLPAERIEAICAENRFPCSVMSAKLGTLHIHLDGMIAEYTPFRAESYARGGAHRPAEVRFGVGMEEDAKRRDFTVNALYCDCLTGELLDPLGGGKDLAAGTLRMATEKTLSEDALRILRLIRFSGELGFSAEENTLAAAKENAPLLSDIAPERMREELMKILISDVRYGGGPAAVSESFLPLPPEESETVLSCLLLAEEIGAWEYLVPELTAGRGMEQRKDMHRHTVLNHAFHAAACAPPDPLIRLAALLHDIGKPSSYLRDGNFYRHADMGADLAEKELCRLRFSKADTRTVSALVRRHMYDIQGTARESTLRRFFTSLGRTQSARLIALRESDVLGCGTLQRYSAARWRSLFRTMLSDGTPFSVKELAVSGRDLSERLNIRPGPETGRLLERLFDIAVCSPEKNQKDYLLAAAKQLSGRI